MQRRDFLKYFVSLFALSCAGCKKEICQKPVNGTLPIVKIPICYHCNLNCAYCCHFSPIAPKYEMPVEIFEKDLKHLRQITNAKVGTVSLMGGEPLLHSNIKELLKITNKYFPDSNKRITTNGILLADMPYDFYKTCADNDIKIECSHYYKYPNYPDTAVFDNLTKKYKLDIKFNREKIDKFDLVGLNKNKINNDNYKKCTKVFGCTQLDNGKIYPCSVISNIQVFNNRFPKYSIPTSKNDALDIYKISSVEEIIDFLKKPKEVCKYCNFGFNPEQKEWKLSQLNVSEWHK